MTMKELREKLTAIETEIAWTERAIEKLREAAEEGS